MSTDEFQQLWKAYDVRLERTMELSRRLFMDMQQRKARSALRPLIASRILGIVIGVVWLGLMGFCFFVVRSQPVMAVSFAVFFVCTVMGIAGYVKDIQVIQTVSYLDNVVETQKKLARLRSTMVRDLRLGWLQLPFWSIFFVSNSLIRNEGWLFWAINVPLFLFFAAAAVFLYRNITLENAQRKKWVAMMIKAGTGRVARAIKLLKEVEDFEKEA
jgi:hypothetical protein